MSALSSTNTTILDKGGNWNVRSYLWERLIDFSQLALTASTEYEVLKLPANFVPRTLAVIGIKNGNISFKATVTAKSDSSKTAYRQTTFGNWSHTYAGGSVGSLAFNNGTWTLTYTPTSGSQTTETLAGSGYETALTFPTSGCTSVRSKTADIVGCTTLSVAGVSNGETFCLKVDNVPTAGVVKLAVAGDWMDGPWNDALRRDCGDPSDSVPDTVAT